jgi:hypothetical protein
MRPPDNEPRPEELETLFEGEERSLLDNPAVPDEVKAEVTDRLERRGDEILEDEIEDEPLPG